MFSRFKPGHTACAFLGLMLGTLLASRPASAGGLVSDGGFESAAGNQFYSANGRNGPPTLGDGWAVTQGEAAILNVNPYAGYAHGGSQALLLTGGPNTDSLRQALATTPGADYRLSFYAASDDPTATFSVTFGTSSVTSDPVPADGLGDPTDYTHFVFDVTADGASTPLTFTGQAPNGTYGILMDDVSLSPASAPVPEASTWAQFALLLCGIVVTAARTQRSSGRS